MKSKEQEIFELVANRQIIREEALELLKALYQGNEAPVTERLHAQSRNQAGNPDAAGQPGVARTEQPDTADCFAAIAAIVAEKLHIPVRELNAEVSFKDLGVDSISGVEIIRDINQLYGINLDAVTLYDDSTLTLLTTRVLKEWRNVKPVGTTISKPQNETWRETQPVAPRISLQPKSSSPGISVPDDSPVGYGAGTTVGRSNKSLTDVREKLRHIVSSILHLNMDEINDDISFKDLGVDSISGVEIIRDVNTAWGTNLDAVTIYDYSTLNKLAELIGRTCSQIPATASDALVQPVPMRESEITRKVVLKPSNPTPPRVSEPSNALPNIAISRTVASRTVGSPGLASIQDQLKQILSAVLHIDMVEIKPDVSFKDLGADSISGVEIIRDVNRIWDLHFDAVTLYDYSTIDTLAVFIDTEINRNRSLTPTEPDYPELHNDMAFVSKVGENLPDSFSSPENLAPNRKEKLKLKTAAPEKRPEPAPVPEVRRAIPEVPEPRPRFFETQQLVEPAKRDQEQDVAVIGMSGRFPGAENLAEFWRNLENGIDSIIEVPKERWDINQYYDPNPNAPNKTYCKLGGYLKEVDLFDPLFFFISPKEAEFMDPQQRIFLEESWKALEDAGYSDRSLSNVKCGVFVGTAQSDYAKKLGAVSLDNQAEAFTGLAASILASRISYFLNLTGPSIAMDTACSSSLVAIHEACRSIINEESDMAIAGGVMLMLTPDLHIKTSKIGMLSPTGKCRTFDQDADGTIFSEGVGVLVLKPYRKALRDRDFIYGVIKGSSINQDGKTNGITAPCAQSQTRLELEVYRRAGINPERISYIEAHGTGTSLGDPIEIKALQEAFRNYTSKKQFCSIGSVKTNIGHTTMASGVASVIKVLLAMKYKKIPPLLNFRKPNEHINFADSPFYINTRLEPWKAPAGLPRMAAVSAFGFSGTNCHLVIEEARE